MKVLNEAAMKALALARDDFTCRKCGHKGPVGLRRGCIQVHHKRRGSNCLANLVTLCVICHHKADARKRTLGIRRSVAAWRARQIIAAGRGQRVPDSHSFSPLPFEGPVGVAILTPKLYKRSSVRKTPS